MPLLSVGPKCGQNQANNEDKAAIQAFSRMQSSYLHIMLNMRIQCKQSTVSTAVKNSMPGTGGTARCTRSHQIPYPIVARVLMLHV